MLKTMLLEMEIQKIFNLKDLVPAKETLKNGNKSILNKIGLFFTVNKIKKYCGIKLLKNN